MKSHYPGCQLDDKCTCQDFDDELEMADEKAPSSTTPKTDATLEKCYERFDSLPNELIVLCESFERELTEARRSAEHWRGVDTGSFAKSAVLPQESSENDLGDTRR